MGELVDVQRVGRETSNVPIAVVAPEDVHRVALARVKAKRPQCVAKLATVEPAACVGEAQEGFSHVERVRHIHIVIVPHSGAQLLL